MKNTLCAGMQACGCALCLQECAHPFHWSEKERNREGERERERKRKREGERESEKEGREKEM